MVRRTRSSLPESLVADIQAAGYLPAVVHDVIVTAVGRDTVVTHLVHDETTFDEMAVRNHLTVLVLTDRRLVIAHADDHEGPEGQRMATATTETVPLRSVRGVMLTHTVPDPERYDGGLGGRGVTLTLGWGAVSRVDLLPAICEDPQCEGDHGYEGTVSSDDISLRVATETHGEQRLEQTLLFASELSARLGH
ncbi:hypothetical protein SGUI_0597 [Serinicoccus hydrothermalis]|uniref:Phosphodiesterase n=1 Tax=Serinicoccus hydrothermalis TaxID=1758689 RepID=A0A1B1N971_9MICO|nr:DUF5998 family protein [Serinicoccus hydrothermalis]ANS77993.1 hypothetical protein SGUI_0597 [Serinicoccus hydrothermalis]